MNLKMTKQLFTTLLILTLVFIAGQAFAKVKVLSKNNIYAFFEKKYNGKYGIVLDFPEYVSTRDVKNYIRVPSVQRINVYRSSNQIHINGDFRLHKSGGYDVIIKKGIKIYGYEKLREDIKLHVNPELKSLFADIIQVMPLTRNKNELGFRLILPGQIITSNIREKINIFPETDYAYSIDWDYLDFFGNFKPNTNYMVQIKKGFSTTAFEAKKDIGISVKTGDYNPSVRFKDSKKYVSSETEGIEVEAVNIDEIKVKILKVNESNINYISIFNPKYLNDKWYIRNVEKFGKVVSKFRIKVPKNKNKIFNIPVDLKNNLKGQSDGIYMIEIKSKSGNGDRKILIKSDIGIASKLSKDQIFFTLNSLSDNKPIKDAEIEVFDKTNELLFKLKSNKEGIAVKNYSNLAAKSPALAIVRAGEKINFIRFENSVSDYNILSDGKAYNYSNYKALMFFERSLARPGDSINLLIAVKDEYFNALANKNIKLKVFDPTGKLLVEKNVKTDDKGSAEYKFKTYSSYKTGKYRFKVLIGESEIGNHELFLETFLPEKISVSVKTNKEKYFLNEKINTTVSSKYLFGSPASGLKCTTELTVTQGNDYFQKFKGYTFFNKMKNKDRVYYEKSITSTLDKNGKATFIFPLTIKKTSYPLLNSTLLTTVYDDGRAVRKYKTVKIFPYKKIVGIKKITEETSETGNPVEFETILIDPFNEKRINAEEDITVTVFKEYWHYYAGYELRKITEFKAKTNSKFKYVPPESGNYKIVVKNSQGQEAALNLFVSGWNFSPFNLKDKSAYDVKITTDKETYKRGENLKFDLKSPISGKLLITLEENEVKQYFIYEMKSNTFKGKIKLPNELNKGFYLKAFVIRPTDTGNKILPFRAIGRKYVKIDNSEHNINVKIIVKPKTKSFEKLKIKVKTVKNANVVISVVDTGILNIINEKPVDAFEFFVKPIKDDVSLFDIYSDLLAIYKLKTETPSGGDGVMPVAKMMSKHQSPSAINKRVKPFSFWSTIIKSNDDGEAEYVLDIPQYNGKILIQAVAVNENAIGSAYEEVIVKDDIIVKPVLPRFIVEGDDIEIPLRVFNTMDTDTIVKLSYECSKNLNIKLTDENIIIKAKSNSIVKVDLSATDYGESFVKFYAEIADGKKYFSSTHVQIMPKFDTKYIVRNGVVTKGKVKLDFDNIKLPKGSIAYVSVSGSPYTSLQKSVKYLIGYPYGCAEQTSSRIFAMLYSDIMLDKSKPENEKLLRERENFINAGISKLISMQNYKGFFTYWPGGYYVNHYASTYAVLALTEAYKAGFSVPDFVLEKAIKADEGYYNSKNGKYPFLYLSFKDDIKLANYLYDEKKYGDKISNIVVLASIMKRHGNKEAFEGLMFEAKEYLKSEKRIKRDYYSEDFYSYIKDVAFALKIYLENINNDKEDEFVKDLFSIINRYVSEERLYSTQDRAFVLMALYKYYGKDISSDETIDAIIRINGVENKIKSEFYKEFEISSADIEIENKSKILSYSVELGIPEELGIKKAKDKNDFIYAERTFYDKNGNIIKDYNSFKTGQKLIMKISAVAKDNVKNVVVNAKIPSSFEIMNPNLYKVNLRKFKNKNLYLQYADYRDDRVLLFIDLKANRKTEFYVPVIVSFTGKFIMPAMYIEAMYDSRLNNYFKEVKNIEVK